MIATHIAGIGGGKEAAPGEGTRDDEGKRGGEISEEFRRGYLLGDRLLRPSMVKVAKG